jgi:hypothetical protein
MLSDPQAVTVNGAAKSLPLTKAEVNSRSYTTAEGDLVLLTRQQVTKDRFRREVRLTPTIVATDPLSSEQDYQSASVYLVIDEPRVGFTDVQLGYYVEALKTWLSSGNQAKLFAGEM